MGFPLLSEFVNTNQGEAERSKHVGKFWQGCLLKSDMRSGDITRTCRDRLSIRNLQDYVGSRNCHCHSFAACTVDVTVCFGHQTVSALTSGLSRYSAQPTPWWLHLAYFSQKTGSWHISCHRHPQSSPLLPWDLFVIQILPQHRPSCILFQYEVRCPCTVERLVDASPFLLSSPW